MEYRAQDHLDSLTRLLLVVLMWVGGAGIAWNLFRPGGWLYWIFDLIARNQPVSYYYLAVGALGLLAGKILLDNVYPRAFYDLLTVACAFAGTFFILSLLLFR